MCATHMARVLTNKYELCEWGVGRQIEMKKKLNMHIENGNENLLLRKTFHLIAFFAFPTFFFELLYLFTHFLIHRDVLSLLLNWLQMQYFCLHTHDAR